MSAKFDWVEDIIFKHLLTVVPEAKESSPGKRDGIVAWKNLPFEPQKFKLWLKVINAPITESAATLGVHGDNNYQGFLQIGVYQKIGTGTKESKAMINRLNAGFPYPFQFNAPPGCILRVEGKGASSGGQTSVNDFTTGGTENVWDADYITVYWLAREPR
jgi:hypothetical protein